MDSFKLHRLRLSQISTGNLLTTDVESYRLVSVSFSVSTAQSSISVISHICVEHWIVSNETNTDVHMYSHRIH